METWSASLSNSPSFTRVEVDRQISKSGKERRSGSHHTQPTRLIRAKTYLEDEYLHEIEATHVKNTFMSMPNDFSVSKETKALTT